MARSNDKRARLIEAADTLIYENTFNLTTLAHIAQRAEVPLGNVYYYFKTKDEILKAVLQNRLIHFQTKMKEWDLLSNPRLRIDTYLKENISLKDNFAKFGCNVGSLCQELAKESGQISSIAAQFLNISLNWLEEQFKFLGYKESATLAEHLLSCVQGTALLMCSFKNPELAEQQVLTLNNWLNKLSHSQAA